MVPPDLGPAVRPPVPVGPSVEAWRAMGPDAKEEFLVAVIDALTPSVDAMTEGRPHKQTKERTIDCLGLHFRTLGRGLYLAEELAVVYPEEAAFAPDVIAVLDVVQPEHDERLAWVVAEEGRGIDLVLEVLHRGDRKKDLINNVQRYARLSIPEYFVYDRARQQVLGHRLAEPDRYERIVPQGGRTRSEVLGIDFAVQGGELALFQGAAELYGTGELLGRLNEMIGGLGRKAAEADERLEQLEAEARQQRERADLATTQSRLANERLRAGIHAALSARGLSVSSTHRDRIGTCEDADRLGGWLLAALAATSTDEALA